MQAVGHAVIKPFTYVGSWAAQHYIYAGAAGILTALCVKGSIDETKGKPLKDRISDAASTAVIIGALSTTAAIVAQKILTALGHFISAHPFIALGAGIVILGMIGRNAHNSEERPVPRQDVRDREIDIQ